MYIVQTFAWMLIYVWTQYWHVCIAPQPHFISHQARSALQHRRVSAPPRRRSSSFWEASIMSPVFSTDRPPRRGLPRPNCHSHWFTSYTLLPRLPSAAAVQCHSFPPGSLTSCAGCTGEEWYGSGYQPGTRGSVELCPPYWLLEPNTGRVLARAHTTWSPPDQHAPSAPGRWWAVSAPQRCWSRPGGNGGHQCSICRMDSLGVSHPLDAGSRYREAADEHTNSLPKEQLNHIWELKHLDIMDIYRYLYISIYIHAILRY